MWQAIWKLAARRATPWYLAVLIVMVGYALFRHVPLGRDDLVPALLGAIQGWVLAFRLFRDPPGVSAFVFSRPFSRRRLFLYRWLIGLGYQAVTLLLLLLLLAAGLREWVQVEMARSAWYPMARWYELSGLWPVGLVSLAVYQATCFVIVRNRLVRDSPSRFGSKWHLVFFATHDRAVRFRSRVGKLVALVSTALIVVIAVLGLAHLAVVAHQSGSVRLSVTVARGLLVYASVLVVMTTLGGLCCYRRLEVEA